MSFQGRAFELECVPYAGVTNAGTFDCRELHFADHFRMWVYFSFHTAIFFSSNM